MYILYYIYIFFILLYYIYIYILYLFYIVVHLNVRNFRNILLVIKIRSIKEFLN